MGICMELPPVDPCAALDEQTCIATTGCQAIYGPCQPCDCVPDDPDCSACEQWRACGFMGCESVPPPPDPCAGLDEQTCAVTTGCQANYIETCSLCEGDTLCNPETPCYVTYDGCVSIPLPTFCYNNEDCGDGMVCNYDSSTNCGGERVDGGANAPVNCGGICVPA
jgi:hypothetical protein